MISINYKKIVSVDKSGISYRLSDGSLKKIDFSKCLENFDKAHPRVPGQKGLELNGRQLIVWTSNEQSHTVDLSHWSEEEFQKYKKQVDRANDPTIKTGLGERDCLAKPMYLEFFDEPRVRIEFPYWIFRKRSYLKFNKLCRDLEDLGYTTFDLT